MQSALYVGTVRHQRTTPVRNGFAYTAYFAYLDLAELDDLDVALRLFGHDQGAGRSPCATATTGRGTARPCAPGSTVCWPRRASTWPAARSRS